MYYLTKTLLIKLSFCVFITGIASSAAYAQTDTIFQNSQKIACSVKEITPEAVKYTYPGEDIINSVYKNTIQKIVFKSGRVQTFAEATSYKTVNSVNDFENVTVTAVEGEVKGLYKLGDVDSKAKGTTVYSNQERVKQRAYRKLKIQAAMLGANIIYLTNQRTEGNKYGSYYTSGSSAETNLTGVAYSNILPDFEKFKALIGNRNVFTAIKRFKLWASDSDVSEDEINKKFVINNITNENGIIIIDGHLDKEDNTRFQVASFSEQTFSVAFRDKSTAYNFVIGFQ